MAEKIDANAHSSAWKSVLQSGVKADRRKPQVTGIPLHELTSSRTSSGDVVCIFFREEESLSSQSPLLYNKLIAKALFWES